MKKMFLVLIILIASMSSAFSQSKIIYFGTEGGRIPEEWGEYADLDLADYSSLRQGLYPDTMITDLEVWLHSAAIEQIENGESPLSAKQLWDYLHLEFIEEIEYSIESDSAMLFSGESFLDDKLRSSPFRISYYSKHMKDFQINRWPADDWWVPFFEYVVIKSIANYALDCFKVVTGAIYSDDPETLRYYLYSETPTHLAGDSFYETVNLPTEGDPSYFNTQLMLGIMSAVGRR